MKGFKFSGIKNIYPLKITKMAEKNIICKGRVTNLKLLLGFFGHPTQHCTMGKCVTKCVTKPQ